MSGEESKCEVQGAWAVEPNAEGTGVIISFQEMSIQGVEVFTTSIPPEHCLRFGEEVIRIAKEMLDAD